MPKTSKGKKKPTYFPNILSLSTSLIFQQFLKQTLQTSLKPQTSLSSSLLKKTMRNHYQRQAVTMTRNLRKSSRNSNLSLKNWRWNFITKIPGMFSKPTTWENSRMDFKVQNSSFIWLSKLISNVPKKFMLLLGPEKPRCFFSKASLWRTCQKRSVHLWKKNKIWSFG